VTSRSKHAAVADFGAILCRSASSTPECQATKFGFECIQARNGNSLFQAALSCLATNECIYIHWARKGSLGALLAIGASWNRVAQRGCIRAAISKG